MEKLFVYGTLQDPDVQKRVFGRITSGTPDQLIGFRKVQYEGYPMAIPDASGHIDGQVLSVSRSELAQMDIYEGDNYRRERVSLSSGIETWVYRNASWSGLSGDTQ